MPEVFVIFGSERTTWEKAKARYWNGLGDEMNLIKIRMTKPIDRWELEESQHIGILNSNR